MITRAKPVVPAGRTTRSAAAEDLISSEGVVRGLGRWDATMLTVGSVTGTGIFITTADIARVLPHQALILGRRPRFRAHPRRLPSPVNDAVPCTPESRCGDGCNPG